MLIATTTVTTLFESLATQVGDAIIPLIGTVFPYILGFFFLGWAMRKVYGLMGRV